MLLYCQSCGTLLGVREPFANSTIDNGVICLACAMQEPQLANKLRDFLVNAKKRDRDTKGKNKKPKQPD